MWQQRQNHRQALSSSPLAPRQIHNQRLPLQPHQTAPQPRMRKRSRTPSPHRLRQSRNFAVNHPPRSLRRHIPRTQPRTASRYDQRILLVAKLMQQRSNRLQTIRHQPPPNGLARPLLRQHPRHHRPSQIHLRSSRTPVRNRHYPNPRHQSLPTRHPNPDHLIQAPAGSPSVQGAANRSYPDNLRLDLPSAVPDQPNRYPLIPNH